MLVKNDIFKVLKDSAGEAQTLLNIGGAYYSLGNYAEALNYHQQAIEINRQIGNVKDEASSLMNVEQVYFNLGQFIEAMEYNPHLLELMQKIGDVAGEADVIIRVGNMFQIAGLYNEALKYYENALYKAGDRAPSIKATALSRIGSVHRSLGQHVEALDYYRQALKIQQKVGNAEGEAQVLHGIARVYIDLNRYNDAIQLLEKSKIIAEQREALQMSWMVHAGLGEALWKSGKGNEAVGSYNKAIEIIENLYYMTVREYDEGRSMPGMIKSHVYEQLFELLLALHEKHPGKGYDKKAFMVSEKAKSRVFQALMSKARARDALASDDNFKKVIRKEEQVTSELADLRRLFAMEVARPVDLRDEKTINNFKERLLRDENTLQKIRKETETKYPRYADLEKPKPLNVEDLQDFLKSDETVLSYSMGKEKSVAFVIGKKKFTLIKINAGKQELSGLVQNFRKGLDDVHKETWYKDLEKFKPEVAYKLYQKIVQPIASELKDVKKLYISADDVLYTLPFEALVDQAFDQAAFEKAKKEQKAYVGEYGTLHYLIDNPYTITYLPSASVLRSLRKYEKKGYGNWQKFLIAYADPIFSENEEEQDESGERNKGFVKGVTAETVFQKTHLLRSTGNGDLMRLPDSADEAKAISQAVGGKEKDIYLREKATEENVYTADLKKARYILFSTHGLLGGNFQDGVAEPSLVLTLIGNPAGRDGFLTMSEVLGLDLNAEQVILSACNTSGQGEKAGQGEGFAGLTRSFMYAGTKSILVTHWSVDSEAAKDLLVDMFNKMRKQSKPKALKNAKLAMKGKIREESGIPLSLSHPFFWAPFVLVGEAK